MVVTFTHLMDILDVLTSAVDVSTAAGAGAGAGFAAGTTAGTATGAGVGVAVAAAGTSWAGGFFWGLMLPTVR